MERYTHSGVMTHTAKTANELTITPVRFAGDSESSLRWKKFDTVKVAVGGFVPLSFERIGFVLAPSDLLPEPELWDR